MGDKIDLLDEVEPIIFSKKKLDLSYFLKVLFILSFISALLFPKIYIQQQIYFKSRDIAKLKAEYDMLKEENRLIKTSVEEIRYKNQILDTLF